MIDPNCIFCKIVNGDIPSEKIFESEHIFAFMDINPLASGHCLFIPKMHAEKAHEVSKEALAEILPTIKKVALALNLENYNILQNNGKLAHQEVPHAHWHLIPKPNKEQGLGIGWKPTNNEEQKDYAVKIREYLSHSK